MTIKKKLQFKDLNNEKQKEKIQELILYISLIIMFPLMIVHLVFVFSHIMMPFWFMWLSFVLCSLITFGCGINFFKNSYKEIFKWKTLGMNTLVTIATSVAYFYSFYPLAKNTINYINGVHSHNFDFFDTAAMIVLIVNLGEQISDKLKKRSNQDIEKIVALQVKNCLLYDPISKQTKEIETKNVKIGDLLQVNKGTRIPVDGIIVEGETDIDESMLTGEEKSIHKKIKNVVIGSTNNLTSTIIVKATAIGKNTVVSNIINNVKKISSKKPKYQKIVDKLASWFTPLVICLAIATLFLHIFIPGIENIGGSFNTWIGSDMNTDFDKYSLAIFYSVGTLAIACPCALGIAAPAATLVGTAKAAKNGIIINTAETYEKIKKIDVIAFDKTGTLTEGKLIVKEFLGNEKNLKFIYQMEKHSIHPLATSFVTYIESQKIKIEKNDNIKDIKEIAGYGIVAKINNKKCELISIDNAFKNKYEFHKQLNDFTNKYKEHKINIMQTYVCYVIDKKVQNIIVFEDKLSDNAFDTIQILKKLNIKTCIISGDNLKSVEFAAKKLGIDKFYASVKPSEKSEIIKQLQQEYGIVSYVGDGINDLEALKQSNLSIAINKENSVAQAVSDILILNHDLMSILKAIEITKITRKMIIFNLVWAFAYNIITIPLSMIGIIPPFIGVFVMATSDITVIGNTLIFRMRKFRYISKKHQKELINKNINPYI